MQCDTFEYEKFYKNKGVGKMLTISEWLNEIEIRENVNFSNVIQKEYSINACLKRIVCVIVFIYGNILSLVIVSVVTIL